MLMAKKKIIFVNSNSNCEPVYTMGKTGDIVLCDTRPAPEGGIGSSLTILLPIASDHPGRMVTIKDIGAYIRNNDITVERRIPDIIDSGSTAITFDFAGEYRTFVSDGKHTWYQIG